MTPGKDAYAMIECKRLSCTRNSRCLMHRYSLQLMLEQNTALELFTEGHKKEEGADFSMSSGSTSYPTKSLATAWRPR